MATGRRKHGSILRRTKPIARIPRSRKVGSLVTTRPSTGYESVLDSISDAPGGFKPISGNLAAIANSFGTGGLQGKRDQILLGGRSAGVFGGNLNAGAAAFRVIIRGVGVSIALIALTYLLLRKAQEDQVEDIAAFFMAEARGNLKKGGYGRGPRGGRVPVPAPRFPHIYSRTGHLSDSLGVVAKTVTATSLTLVVGNEAEYAAALEFGTKNIRARHWIQKTFDSNKDTMRRMAERNTKSVIPQVDLRFR